MYFEHVKDLENPEILNLLCGKTRKHPVVMVDPTFGLHKNPVNSPVEGKVVEITWFTRFCTSKRWLAFGISEPFSSKKFPVLIYRVRGPMVEPAAHPYVHRSLISTCHWILLFHLIRFLKASSKKSSSSSWEKHEKHRGGRHQQFDFKRKENIGKRYKKTACRYGFQGQEIHYWSLKPFWIKLQS